MESNNKVQTMLPAIGYTIRETNPSPLVDPAVNAAEIAFDRASEPLRVDRYLRNREFDLVSVHALKLSVAGPERPEVQQIDALKEIAEENGAQSVSDHLAFTRRLDYGREIVISEPPPYTRTALAGTCRNIRLIQKRIGNIRFYIENITYASPLRGTLTEAEFLSQVLERTGCGWLLNVTNVYVNAMNFGFDAYDFIEEVMPNAAHVQMHITGACYDENLKRYVDSRWHPVPEPVWDLYRFGLEMAHTRAGAVFIEREGTSPDDNRSRDEFQMVREIAEEVGAIA